MFTNYLKFTLRSLLKNRSYSIINIVGLTFGLSIFLLLGLYLFDEYTFDQDHKNTDRLYRIIQHRKSPTENISIAAAGYNVAEQSKKKIAEIENTARMTRTGRANLENPENKNVFQETVTNADNGLMEIFDFEAIEGNPKTALVEPNTIVLTEDVALRLFHSTNVTGKTVKWEFMEEPLKITAVIKNHPRNSSFDFTSVYSQAGFMSDTAFISRSNRDWTSENYSVYVLLKEKSDPTNASNKLTDLVRVNSTEQADMSRTYSLQALKDLHLKSQDIIDGARNSNVNAINSGSPFYLRIFAFVAIFVLFIACINYMNLTTAKASNRSREIGIRKTSGAYRGQLISQFLIESVLIASISFFLSIGLINLLLPAFNLFTNKALSLNLNTDSRIWIYSILATVVTGLVSGSYPALIMSGYNPILLLKNLKMPQKNNVSLRKGLVVFQFTVSVIMIIATLVLFLQIKYIQNKDLGFNKDLLVVVDINSAKVRTGAETIISEFSKIPNVKSVSTTSRVPGEWKSIPTVKVNTEINRSEVKEAYFLSVDENFTKTFDIKLKDGRTFSSPMDTNSIMLNAEAAKLLNIRQANGEWIEIPERAFGGSYARLRNNRILKGKVIGIVNDFNFQSLREKIAPLIMGYKYNPVHTIDYYTARIDGLDIPATLKKMENVIATIDPTHLFEYHFLDQQLALFYIEDAKRQKMLIWTALAAIFIACMGLFGLATFAAEQRTKEIGVRKVLGARVSNIASLLSIDFVKLVIISILVASPLAYLLMNKWLAEFAYKTTIYWWVFVLAGVIAIGIAVLTISYQAIKAAVANPVKSLRSE